MSTDQKNSGSSAVAGQPKHKTPTKITTKTDKKVFHLPKYKVLLHNDPINKVAVIIKRIMDVVKLNADEAKAKTIEAHEKGVALLLITHKELAELYQDQFASCEPPVKVTIESV